MIKYKDRSGVLLVVVLIIVMIMMILSVTIVSQSMSQSRGSRYQADQVVGEQWAKGLFWEGYNSSVGSATFQCSYGNVPSYTMNNRSYSSTCTYNPGTGLVSVTITY